MLINSVKFIPNCALLNHCEFMEETKLPDLEINKIKIKLTWWHLSFVRNIMDEAVNREPPLSTI